MASRLKEDEKNERVIRGLLKLQHNRRCINCNSLGPQYVCTNFWTFVCINCSGIHREFTHRVKSVSMAKFTSQEVSALQEGGNQRAKEIYFKEWDAQRHSFPDSSIVGASNVDRLRDFIKHVYVDRRFTSEKTNEKPPRVKAGDKDDFYQGGSKSPPYEDAYERRYSDRSSPGGRSPGYDQESRQYGDYKRSPGRPPILNDWRREDRRISDGDYKVESQSPERAKDADSSSPPVVRPVRDILGENVVPLRISEPPKPNSGRPADSSALTQRTASSSSLASGNENPVDVKLETTKSLIDFDDDPELPVAPSIPPAQQTTVPQPVVQPANSSNDNWASFDVAPGAKSTPSPSNLSPLESVLSQLSMPASLPAQVSGVQGSIPASSLTSTSGAASVSGFSAFPPSNASVPSPGLTSVLPLNNAGQWASLQQQQTLFPAAVSQSTTQQFTPPLGGAANNQLWNVHSVPTVQGHPSTPMPHHASKPANEATSSVLSQPPVLEVASGRKELPALWLMQDLFTVKYPSFPAPVRGWQMGVPHGMGISMQYNNVVPVPSFPQSSKSTNPFDVSSEPTPNQAPTFPSMSSLQGALPSVPPAGAVHPSGMGYPTHAWTPPPPSSFLPVLPTQAQIHASALGPRAYMGQQMPTNMPMAMPRQEVGYFGNQGAVFGLSSQDQQLAVGIVGAQSGTQSRIASVAAATGKTIGHFARQYEINYNGPEAQKQNYTTALVERRVEDPP
ncbi:Arf-GAP domain and FG repeat-containing protein 1 [Mucuna pruriens]|uniref:Arf-GAP domain and FG repeat-containing protein 1 n=1 Tax=Mucuna pruriens TaxID=157652 RepID=A0A371HZY0_MUCPR|nr:Arf-GAP domain and FG repeat-containing protein 1 [Mucuna pruriens]